MASGYFGQQYFGEYYPPASSAITGSADCQLPLCQVNGLGQVPETSVGNLIAVTIRQAVRGQGQIILPGLEVDAVGRVRQRVRGRGHLASRIARVGARADLTYLREDDEELVALDAMGVL